MGTPAGTIRMPPVSRSGSRAADGHQSRIIQRARTRQARARECRGGTGCRSPGRQGAGRCGCPDRPSSYSGITLSDEGGLKRTHADPPICMLAALAAPFWEQAPNQMICGLREPGGQGVGTARTIPPLGDDSCAPCGLPGNRGWRPRDRRRVLRVPRGVSKSPGVGGCTLSERWDSRDATTPACIERPLVITTAATRLTLSSGSTWPPSDSRKGEGPAARWCRPLWDSTVGVLPTTRRNQARTN